MNRRSDSEGRGRAVTIEEKLRIGAMLKKRKDEFAQMQFEGIRRAILKELNDNLGFDKHVEFSAMQTYLAWYVLQGAGVVPPCVGSRSSMVSLPSEREQALLAKIAALEENQSRISKLEKALKQLGLEVPD